MRRSLTFITIVSIRSWKEISSINKIDSCIINCTITKSRFLGNTPLYIAWKGLKKKKSYIFTVHCEKHFRNNHIDVRIESLTSYSATSLRKPLFHMFIFFLIGYLGDSSRTCLTKANVSRLYSSSKRKRQHGGR